jgi:hypothetical protein
MNDGDELNVYVKIRPYGSNTSDRSRCSPDSEHATIPGSEFASSLIGIQVRSQGNGKNVTAT